MFNAAKVLQLVHQASTLKTNHPKAWAFGEEGSQDYFDTCVNALKRKVAYEGLPDLVEPPSFLDLPPSNDEEIGPRLHYALNYILPGALESMHKDGVFEKLGIEYSEESLTAYSVAFVLKLDEKFKAMVKLNRDAGGIPGLQTPKRTGCLGLLLLAPLFLR